MSDKPEPPKSREIAEGDDQPVQKDVEFQRSQRRWKVRRRMAVGSFVMLVLEVVGTFGLVAFDKIDADTLMAFATFLATPTVAFVSIIGLYIGFGTKDDIKMAEIASVAKS